jgi:hypothetical protein
MRIFRRIVCLFFGHVETRCVMCEQHLFCVRCHRDLDTTGVTSASEHSGWFV